MAFRGLDHVLAGLSEQVYQKNNGAAESASVWTSLWLTAGGFPVAAAAPAAGIDGEALVAPVVGQVRYVNPVPGTTKHLARATFRYSNAFGQSCHAWLADRLWQNSGIVVTTTTEQALNSVAWPTRDLDGSSNARGVYVALEATVATGNGGAVTTMTLNYTNSDGVAGRTGTLGSSAPWPATANVGSFVPFLLQAGDVGVRSVQGITLAASLVSGAVSLVAFRPIAAFGETVAARNQVHDAVSLGLPRLFDGSVPFFIAMDTSTNVVPRGGLLHWSEG